MKDKSKLVAIILAILTISVVFISFISGNKKKEEEYSISIVNDYSNFYTVNSCLYRTITYLSTNDYESVYLILDDKYKKEHNIKKESVLDLFANVSENSTFVSKKMYQQKVSENITKYYVYGKIEANQIFDEEFIDKLSTQDAYFIVYLDTNNKIFSVEPYSGDIFIGGDINE